MIITLNALGASDPYSVEALFRDSAKVSAIQGLIQDDDRLFRHYVRAKRPSVGHSTVTELVDIYRQLIIWMRDEGYNADEAAVHALAHGRKPSPICGAIDADGHIWIKDGNHRAITLMLLGQPIEMQVLGVDPEWQQSVGVVGGSRLYQPHPHPMFLGLPAPIRAVTERYTIVGEFLDHLMLHSCCEIGSNYATGTLVMAAAAPGIDNFYAYEINETCKHLARSQVAALKARAVTCLDAWEGAPPEVEAYVGLSVWHHLAKDLGTLKAWCDATVGAMCQVIELPAPGETRWSDKLLQELNADFNTVGALVLDEIIKAGGYEHRRVLFTDKAYGGREAVALWRG